jgi:hypothetical protein
MCAVWGARYTLGARYLYIKRNVEKVWGARYLPENMLLLRVMEHRNILHEISKWNANWIGHILHINCLLLQVIEQKVKGRIEVTER